MSPMRFSLQKMSNRGGLTLHLAFVLFLVLFSIASAGHLSTDHCKTEHNDLLKDFMSKILKRFNDLDSKMDFSEKGILLVVDGLIRKVLDLEMKLETAETKVTANQEVIKQKLDSAAAQLVSNSITYNSKLESKVVSMETRLINECFKRIVPNSNNSKCEIKNQTLGNVCQFGYVSNGKSCYKIHNNQVDWNSALGVCKKEAAYLVTIDSKQEQTFLESYVRYNGTFSNDSEKGFWIGGNDLNNDGVWIWESSQLPITSNVTKFTNWINARNIIEAKCAPDGELKNNETCVRIIPEDKTWEDANKYCSSQKNGSLLTVEDKETEEFLQNTVLKGRTGQYWIGGYITAVTKKIWYWTNGDKLTYFNWWPLEPNDMNSTEDHIMLRYDNTFLDSNKLQFHWNDENGNSKINRDANKYVCQFDGISCINRDEYISHGSTCYLLLGDNKGTTWYDAKKSCEMRKGHLARIEDKVTHDLIVARIKSNIQYRGNYWIGATLDRGNTLIKKWIHGGHIQSSLWDSKIWMPRTNDKLCVAIDAQKFKLQTKTCNQKKAFLCKYTPNYENTVRATGWNGKCMEMADIRGKMPGRWRDADCKKKNEFICEISP